MGERSIMDSSLEDVEFLVRSEHRVAVLDVLADGPHSRAELRAITGASPSTISRLLREFEARYWIQKEGHWFEATPLGVFVVEGLTTLLDRMDTERTLREVVRWFPAEDVEFDVVERLSDAEVVLSTESDPMAPIRRASEQVRAGIRLRFLTTQVTVSYLNSVREAVAHDDLTVEGVVTPGVYDTLVNDTAVADVYHDLHDSDDTAFFVVENVPLILQIIDSNVGIGLVDETKTPQGFVCSDDDRVHGWAVDTFESCRDGAEPVPRP
ncbi:helix-turn-helix transcriptional regulator [Salinigranum sp. GCM10025319]|uniref:helix-turn-helix transcriptional regulator n=1 Tax=Salinigranum sp. GCM10025319 TaxID=3252687 RepID=UPI00360EE335